MNTDCYVEIPADSLRKAISLAYDLSSPQGLGFIHARDGGLDEATLDAIVSRDTAGIISTDYVHGRACKFTVRRTEDGRLFVSPRWFDHSERALLDLLAGLGVENPAEKVAAANAAQAAENEAWLRENPPR